MAEFKKDNYAGRHVMSCLPAFCSWLFFYSSMAAGWALIFWKISISNLGTRS